MQKMNDLEASLWESLNLFSLDVLSLISRWIRPVTKMDVGKAIVLLEDGI